MSNQPAVVIKKLSKGFRLPHERHNGIKDLVVNVFRRRKGYEHQHVLEDVNFEVKKGEFFGIVGRNGSGKSTLLKLLAGIYVPDKGLVQINGHLTPFIELGVGFNPELTGRENVFLNGALLGLNRKEMAAMYPDIVAFAELSRFMDQKLKNYSSGMQVRLAFSIAIRARQDILLVDEVLAVGDTEFQTKCYKTFRELKEAGRTIIFVTHDMSAVERFCDRVLVLNRGSVHGIYKPREAAGIYERMNATKAEQQGEGSKPKRWGSGEVICDRIQLNGKNAHVVPAITQGKDLIFTFKLKSKTPKPVVVGLAFYDTFGVNIAGPNSIGTSLTSDKQITLTIPRLPFNPGRYSLRVVIFDHNTETEYDHQEEAAVFTVVSQEHQQLHGKINVFGTWQQ